MTQTMSLETAGGLSIPDLAEHIGVRVDRARLLIRRHPELSRLLVRAGHLRVLPPSRLEEFRSTLARLPASAPRSTSTAGT
ncbi:MAG TPA: hypothetical protein VM533_08785 [Fimbriiglobus sp.]|nr:hypothetical protein [Fimbriiglobus sp.]